MGIYKIRVFFLAAALSLVCSTQAAWAAGWVQEQDGQWYYEDGQERLTGWNMIDASTCIRKNLSTNTTRPAAKYATAEKRVQGDSQERGVPGRAARR